MSRTGAPKGDVSGREDPYGLSRFVAAQDHGGAYDAAMCELAAGRKQSHWIWFVFPQIAGLGHSATSRHFSISSLAEARAYLDHVVLGPRLRQSAQALLDRKGRSAEEILGGIDAVKLRSSMTLFLRAAPEEAVFSQVLEAYFKGQGDPATDERL